MTLLITPERLQEKIIVSGIHLRLTAALKHAVHEKVERLLRHEPRILRVRVDLTHDTSRAVAERFVAKGRVEIGGPDLLAQAAGDDAYRSIDALVNRLDRALRKRATDLQGRRTRARKSPRGVVPGLADELTVG